MPFFLCERSQTWVSFMARPELLLLMICPAAVLCWSAPVVNLLLPLAPALS